MATQPPLGSVEPDAAGHAGGLRFARGVVLVAIAIYALGQFALAGAPARPDAGATASVSGAVQKPPPSSVPDSLDVAAPGTQSVSPDLAAKAN